MIRIAFACWLLLTACIVCDAADPLSTRQIEFFETRIRPVLARHCYQCHAAEAEEIGGNLRLDDREGWLQGGESGTALVPGDPAQSLLIQAMKYETAEMPPDQPLPAAVIADFERWIEDGAVDPRRRQKAKEIEAGPPELWSLQPIRHVSIPNIQNTDWPKNEVDQFSLASMEAAGLQPAADADAATLARRLHFDLIGLPPTFEQLEHFVRQASIDRDRAVTGLVEQLLSDPEFGRRWGRHWLDVARYGESNGNDGLGRNPTFPHAWRYRDYVIDSLNDDMPFDRFVAQQIAGDLLPAASDVERDRNLVATGFLAMGSKPAKAMNNNFAMDVVADQIDVVGRGLMGLSVGCARCHDHKTDPIPTVDYYALAGIFTSTETMWGFAGHEALTAPATDLHVLKTPLKNPPPSDFVETVILRESSTGKPKAIPKPKWPVGTPLAMGVRDRAKPADCKVNINGDAKKLGAAVPRGFLTAVSLDGPAEPMIDAGASGRLQLAEWLTHPDHPLTARVIVNRLWLHLFGQGLVRTPDDFGVYGTPPSHRQLLDFLARRMIDRGWSVKEMIRFMVLSRTYQQSSVASPDSYARDPENRLLTRHERRRLDAEALRDRMLFSSNQLDRSPQPGSIVQHRDILVNLAGNLHKPTRRRSIYLCYLRSSPPPSLAAFNLPDFASVTGQRDRAVIPAQALHLMNNPFVVEQSQQLADHLSQCVCDQQRIELAFQFVLQRQPNSSERQAASSLLESLFAGGECERTAWSTFCQSLMMSNEFRYID